MYFFWQRKVKDIWKNQFNTEVKTLHEKGKGLLVISRFPNAFSFRGVRSHLYQGKGNSSCNSVPSLFEW